MPASLFLLCSFTDEAPAMERWPVLCEKAEKWQEIQLTELCIPGF